MVSKLTGTDDGVNTTERENAAGTPALGRRMMSSHEELRLMARVARMYHTEGIRQPAIAEQFNLSQARVSRLLKRAIEEGIVRITVTSPPGTYADLETEIQRRYGLQLAIVVDASDEDEQTLLAELGAAAAHYLETSLRSGDVIGISSWSASLLAAVDAMRAIPSLSDVRVVQILGGIGNPSAKAHANRLTSRLADLVHGEPAHLPSPGVAGSADSAEALRQDPFVAETMALFDNITVALIGIGAVEPSRLLASSGNTFSPGELQELRDAGIVGDICMRFFDVHGKPVRTTATDRVVSIGLDQLRRAQRSVAVAGGDRKYVAIRSALRGGLANVLITDLRTAQRLVDEPE